MGKRALVTGISGFAGSFLAEELLRCGFEVSGTYISSGTKNLQHIKKSIDLHKVDLLQIDEVAQCIKKVKPDILFHLAALTSPAESFKKPSEVLVNNITSQMNILEVIRKENPHTRILITSSADVYGMVEKKYLPVSEEAPLKPGSPYAVSKIAQDFLALQYFISYNMDILRVRPFNHVGPRQSPHFVVASFAKQIADIEKGRQDAVLMVGNLNAKRDFTDVRDMVKAYIALMERGKSGEVYNIGSGKSYQIKEILDILLSLSTEKITVKFDPAKIRPVDTPDIYSDNSKLENVCKWKPEILLPKTLEDTLDYFRNNV